MAARDRRAADLGRQRVGALGDFSPSRGESTRCYHRPVKETLQVLLRLRSEGLLERFAIGGAIAASYYIEAVATEDLDVFALLRPSPSGLLVLTPLYDRLKQLGASLQNEHVVIHGWPVQILPAYTPLVEEAVTGAIERPFHDLAVPVVGAEHLCAIALQTGRPKDFLRVHSLIEAGCVDAALLARLVEKHGLAARWSTYARRYA